MKRRDDKRPGEEAIFSNSLKPKTHPHKHTHREREREEEEAEEGEREEENNDQDPWMKRCSHAHTTLNGSKSSRMSCSEVEILQGFFSSCCSIIDAASTTR